jgi:two-component system sensor histidine kinase GlrK
VPFPRPRSLGGLVLLGFALVSLPLLLGVVSAAVQMSRLSESSQRLVVYGVQATQYSQALVRQTAAMERSARLYQLLGNVELLGVFRENHRRMQKVLDALGSLPGDDARGTAIAEIRGLSAEIASGLESEDRATTTASLAKFGQLSRAGGQLSVLASQQIDRELTAVQAETVATREQLFWQTVALIPLSFGLALAFALLVGKPIRAIDSAINDLGYGRLDKPIEIRGPSDLQSLGRQIEWLRRRLIEVTDERERFLRHMSHELKTPLASIREGAELLLDGTLGQLAREQQEVAGILQQNSLRLQRLIENLLSYSAWQAQNRGLDLSEFKVDALVRPVVDSHRLSIANARQRVELSLEDITIHADRGKMTLILDNLLSNALKFTPHNGVIQVLARALDDDQWSLEVIDDGPGITETDRDRIFEAFYQGSTPQGGLVRGTGIGLSVVRDFVAAHGGSVELVQTGAGGAHFRVRLPRRPHVEKPYIAPGRHAVADR